MAPTVLPVHLLAVHGIIGYLLTKSILHIDSTRPLQFL
jgi:hypothetical protein